jgi:sigma-B regulation protein RsbU (phosphoserine phosphatase)
VAPGILRRLMFWRRRENPYALISRDLMEFSQAFSNVTDMHQLVPSVIGKLRDLIGVDEVALFLINKASGRFELLHSRGIELKPQLRLRGDYFFKQEDKLTRWLLNNRFPFVMSTMGNVFGFFDEEERDILRFVSTELCLPLEAHNRFIGMLCLGPRRDGRPYSEVDLHLLAAVCAQAALAFENNRLQMEMIEKERLKRELEIAGELQRRLLPSIAPSGYPNLDLYGHCIPSTEVGGDYYDYFQLGPDRLALVVGDVAGHGMSAGLLMGMAKSCITTAVRIDPSCSQVMRTLNSLIYELDERRALMTFFYALYEVRERRMTFSNAGHIYPYHYRFGEDRLVSLESVGYPLGVRESLEFNQHTHCLEPGDFIALCSDGFIESRNRRNDEFGFDRLERSIFEHRRKSSQEICLGVETDLFSFLAGIPHEDDLTFLVMKLKG